MTGSTISFESRDKQFYFYCTVLNHGENLKKHSAHFKRYNVQEKKSVIRTGFLNACQAGNLEAVQILLSDKFYRTHSEQENIDMLYSSLYMILASIEKENDTKFAMLDYILYKSPLQLSTKTALKPYVKENNKLFNDLCGSSRAQHFCAIDYFANYIEKHRQNNKNNNGQKYNLLEDTNYDAFKNALVYGNYDIAEGFINRYTITGQEPSIKKLLNFLIKSGDFFLIPNHDHLKQLMNINFDKQLLTKELVKSSEIDRSERIHKI